MINDHGGGYENGVTCSILSITTDAEAGVFAPFCNGEIGRAELEGKETRLHRAAALVSHSVDVATTQITLFCTPALHCTP